MNHLLLVDVIKSRETYFAVQGARDFLTCYRCNSNKGKHANAKRGGACNRHGGVSCFCCFFVVCFFDGGLCLCGVRLCVCEKEIGVQKGNGKEEKL